MYDILKSISFRRQQEIESSGHGSENPALMNELRALRMRKDELENHLTTLQDSRRQLMIQLEGLMKMLKVRELFGLKGLLYLYCFRIINNLHEALPIRLLEAQNLLHCHQVPRNLFKAALEVHHKLQWVPQILQVSLLITSFRIKAIGHHIFHIIQ